jgi:hypothetical protein
MGRQANRHLIARLPFVVGVPRQITGTARPPCGGSVEKGTSRAVPSFFSITQRVPIAVVVGVTGEYFGFVVLDFFSIGFCSGNDRRDILC